MSILIKNVEMPTDHPMWIVVHSDGTVEANEVSASRPVGWQTLRNAAVPVPPHGRLIGADSLYEDCALDHDYDVAATTTRINEYMQLKIDAAPTIIPAEPSKKQKEYEAQVEAAQYCELYEPTYDQETGAL